MHSLLIKILLITSIGYSQERFEVVTDTSIVLGSAQILAWQVGVKELRPNDSPEIKRYLASVDIYKPASYCAAGQYYCFKEAKEYLNLNTAIPMPKTAVANQIYAYGVKNGSKTIYEAKKHDLIIWRKRNSWQGHVERIIKVEQKGWVYTIGFNTGSGDARNGDGVYIRKRNIKHPLGRMQVRGLYGFKCNKK